jgi:hypothetical protein
MMSAEDKREAMPWERPGQVRRDAEPHRGELILALSCFSVAFGILSVWLLPTAIVVLPLAVTVEVLSRTDLRRMRDGDMDPAGRGQILRGQAATRWSTLAVIFAAALWAFIYWI